MAANMPRQAVMRNDQVLRAARALYDFYLRAGAGLDDKHALDSAFDRALDKIIALRSGPDRAVPPAVVAAVDELVQAMQHVTEPPMQRLWLSLFPDLISDQLAAAAEPVTVTVRYEAPVGSANVARWWGTLTGKWQIHSEADLLLTHQVGHYVTWLESHTVTARAAPSPDHDDEPPTPHNSRRRQFALAA
jgi:hypothetical protein